MTWSPACPVSYDMRVLEVACGPASSRAASSSGSAGAGPSWPPTSTKRCSPTRASGCRDRATRRYRTADGTSLPFESRSYDAVVCQFGLMFFPDKTAGAREAFRVLRPGGVYLLNVWDALEHNPVGRITHETIAKFFPTDPPKFYTVPFGYHDAGVLQSLLRDAGFDDVRCERVAKQGQSPSAAEAATGLVEGNPVYGEITQRRPEALAEIKAAIAANLARELGDRPLPRRCGHSWPPRGAGNLAPERPLP